MMYYAADSGLEWFIHTNVYYRSVHTGLKHLFIVIGVLGDGNAPVSEWVAESFSVSS